MDIVTLLSGAAVTTAVGLGLAQAANAQSSADVERPGYEVVIAGENAELRRYDPVIVAEVRVAAGSDDAAASMGFQPLANYIFGQNRPGEKIAMTAPVTTAPITSGAGQAMTGGDGEKIAMTAPVTTAPTEEGVYTVQFVMPSKWTMDTLPAPKNEDVTLRPVETRHVVAARFVGPRLAGSIDRAEQDVAAFIEANGLTPAGPYAVAGYSGPDVPVSDRMWEVHRPVEAP